MSTKVAYWGRWLAHSAVGTCLLLGSVDMLLTGQPLWATAAAVCGMSLLVAAAYTPRQG